MEKYENAIKIMTERFAKDNVIAIATVEYGKPHNRMVDAYYHDGSFYTVTFGLSNKMRQIATNPDVAVCAVDWFTGYGLGENLGHVLAECNAEIMGMVRKAFAAWYDGGHMDESNVNTCLLRIKLTNGLLIDHETKYGEQYYKVDFTNKTA